MHKDTLACCLAVCGLVAGPEAASAASSCDTLVGAWEYVSPSRPGRAIDTKLASGKHLVVWISSSPDNGPVPAGAMEYTCEGAKVRSRVLFSTDPAAVGTEQLMDWELTGDVLRFWALNADRTRGTPGAARRAK